MKTDPDLVRATENCEPHSTLTAPLKVNKQLIVNVLLWSRLCILLLLSKYFQISKWVFRQKVCKSYLIHQFGFATFVNYKIIA